MPIVLSARPAPATALADTMAFDELLAALRAPEVKARVLAERSDASTDLDLAVGARVAVALDRAHPADDLVGLGDLWSGSATSIAAQAEAAGIDAFERCYDALLDRDGAALIHLVIGDADAHDPFGRRLLDDHAVPSWYRAGGPTIVAGVVTVEDGVLTGERPGQLVRGPQPTPAP